MPHKQALQKEILSLWRTSDKPRTITTAGVSMRPLIVEGSTLTFTPVRSERDIATGDIALFEGPGCLVAHRIVGRFQQDGVCWLREKGDNTFFPKSFPAAQLIGRVVKIEHSGLACDLTNVRWRIANRVIGTYWRLLFGLLRAVGPVKRRLLGRQSFPRLRKLLHAAARRLERFPKRFMKP